MVNLKKISIISVIIFLVLLGVIFFILIIQPQSDCFIADNATLIDKKMVGKKDYHLYSVVRGWHDKTESLELFAGTVDFDACGQPSIEPIDAEYIYLGPEQGPQEQWLKHVIISNDDIQIEYTETGMVDWIVEWN